jgi:hypothetical protein
MAELILSAKERTLLTAMQDMGGYASTLDLKGILGIESSSNIDAVRRIKAVIERIGEACEDVGMENPLHACWFQEEGERHRGYRLATPLDKLLVAGVLPRPSQRFIRELQRRQAVGIHWVMKTFGFSRKIAVGSVIEPIVRIAGELGITPFDIGVLKVDGDPHCRVWFLHGSENPDPKWIQGPKYSPRHPKKKKPSRPWSTSQPVVIRRPSRQRTKGSELRGRIFDALKSSGTLTILEIFDLTGLDGNEVVGLLKQAKPPESGDFRWATGPMGHEYLRWIGPR